MSTLVTNQALPMARSLDRLITQWLRQLKIPVAKAFIKEKILSHPDYPSLLSITDALDDIGIENAALVVDKEKLHEIPTPFIAHTGTRGGEFLLVHDMRKHLNKNPEFEKNWDGTVVIAEKPERWKNEKNKKYVSEEKRNRAFRWLTVSIIILFAGVSLSNQFSWQNLGLYITALLGLAVSVLIVQHDLGISNEITEQFCGAGVNTDCDAVMKSKGSKFLRWFNWADAGIIYFSSVFILLTVSFLAGTTQSFISILSLLATCSLPFTLFSVYYQWRVVKKWCPLCLAVVMVLWLQFLLLIPDILQISMQNVQALGILRVAFIITINVILWLQFLKPSLQKNKELTDKNYLLLRFKNNPDIFKALLQQQRRVDITPFENDLQLGNPDADLQIMVACNPYCGPCAKAHEVLHELVENNDIGLTIRIAVKTDNKDDMKLQAVEYILQLLNNTGIKYKRKVLNNWYAWMSLEKFNEKYPMPEDVDVNEQLKMHERWTKESGIEFTPTVFINGYELPKQYKREDLVLIIRKIEKKESESNFILDENNLVSV